MKISKIFVLTIVTLVVILVVSFVGWFILRPVPMMVQGEVAASTVKISTKLVGRIDSMLVRKGQSVRKGDLLFVLRTPEVRQKLRQAEAVHTAASAQDMKAQKGARIQEIESAMNMWKSAEAAATLASKTYDRVKKLYENGVVPAQKLDEAEAMKNATRTQAEAAMYVYQMYRDGARREDKVAAAALAEQASSVVAEVEDYLGESRQYSPIDGEISSIVAEVDELTNAGQPIVTLVDMSDVWVTFNMKETMLPKIKMGSEFDVYVPALDKTIGVKVDYIAVEAEYATWTATRTTGQFDIRTFEVHARPKSVADGLRPGMTVTLDWNKL